MRWQKAFVLTMCSLMLSDNYSIAGFHCKDERCRRWKIRGKPVVILPRSTDTKDILHSVQQQYAYYPYRSNRRTKQLVQYAAGVGSIDGWTEFPGTDRQVNFDSRKSLASATSVSSSSSVSSLLETSNVRRRQQNEAESPLDDEQRLATDPENNDNGKRDSKSSSWWSLWSWLTGGADRKNVATADPKESENGRTVGRSDDDDTAMEYQQRLQKNDKQKYDEDKRSSSNTKNLSPVVFHDYLSSLPIIGHFTHGIIGELQSHVHFIKPGTKWCGDGNKARSYQDVGVLYKTDTCCRDHDKCAHYILSHETKYGLYNDGHWTRSHCDCDLAFYSCLKSVNTPFSTAVGYTYFNVLNMKCFKMEYPIVMCAPNHGWFSKQCSQYIVDMSKPKKWQWFDNYEF